MPRGELRIRRRPGAGDDLVVEVVRANAASLLALARRHSLCADDAHDAYQRALEIFLRRAPTLERRTMVSWLRTVVKHEAWAVRQARQALVSPAEPDLDRHADEQAPDDDERLARFDRMGRAAEALQRLKPQEVRALLLKAEGHSYEEICAITGWSYTKVNRCLTEGRRAFRSRYAGIEAGEECKRWASVLSAVADGEATALQLSEVRPHLRACPACRATVRAYHAAPGQVAVVLPVGLLAAPALVSAGTRLPGSGLGSRAWEVVAGASPAKLSAVAEAATAGKLAVVAASTAALAGGGLAIDAKLRQRPEPRTSERVASAPARPAHRRPVGSPAPGRAAVAAANPAAPTPTPAPVMPTTVHARAVSAPADAAAAATTRRAARRAAAIRATRTRRAATPTVQFGPESGGVPAPAASPASAPAPVASVTSASSSSASSGGGGGRSSAPPASAPTAAAEFAP